MGPSAGPVFWLNIVAQYITPKLRGLKQPSFYYFSHICGSTDLSSVVLFLHRVMAEAPSYLDKARLG